METIYISYSRVSTNEQGERGVSIEAQIEEHDRWARENNVTISHYYQDSGYSAGSFKRPGLQELIGLISKNKKTKHGYPYRYILLIRYQSRLIRDISKKRSLQCVFEKYNVSVHCLNGDWSKEPNAGGIVTDIQMLIDENERLQVSGRVYDSYRHIAMAGCYPIGGRRPPFGYRKEKSGKNWKLVVDPEEAQQIRNLFDLLSTGNYSSKKACAYLNSINLFERKWSWNTLSKLIDNPIYYGRLRTAWFDSEDPTIHESQKTGWYSSECHNEPIITKELFDKVQTTMHRANRKRGNHVYLFKGKVVCSNCGTTLKNRCAWRANSRESVLYKYYYCPNCEKRINELFILERFLYKYPKWERKIKDINFCEQLRRQLANKQKELDLVSELFEEQLLKFDEYSKRFKLLVKEMNQIETELKKIISKKELDWSDLSETEKQEVIQKSVDLISVVPGPIEDGALVLEIRFFEDVPTIRKAKKA